MVLPYGPNQRWSLDFVSDALIDGRCFRILAVVDDFRLKALVLVADTSLSGQRVARELNQIIAERRKLRNECLNETLFGTLRDARKSLERWQDDYNWRKPHSALANLTLMEFLQRKAIDKMAT
jgi:putative transposase